MVVITEMIDDASTNSKIIHWKLFSYDYKSNSTYVPSQLDLVGG